MQLIMTRWSTEVEAENRNLAAQLVSVCRTWPQRENRALAVLEMLLSWETLVIDVLLT